MQRDKERGWPGRVLRVMANKIEISLCLNDNVWIQSATISLCTSPLFLMEPEREWQFQYLVLQTYWIFLAAATWYHFKGSRCCINSPFGPTLVIISRKLSSMIPGIKTGNSRHIFGPLGPRILNALLPIWTQPYSGVELSLAWWWRTIWRSICFLLSSEPTLNSRKTFIPHHSHLLGSLVNCQWGVKYHNLDEVTK